MPFHRFFAPACGEASPGGWRASVLFAVRTAAASAVFSAVLMGCAAPGEPTARHPVVPRAITDLAARQQGNGTVLTFTLPAESTDKKPLGETPAVEIYRGATAPGTASSGRPPARPVDTIPSDLIDSYKTGAHIEFRDEFDPAELARQPGQQVTYTVRTRVSGERESADSNAVKLIVYPAPQPASELRATLMEKSIALSWAPSETASGTGPEAGVDYRVYRTEIPSAAPAADSNAGAHAAPQPIALVHSTAYQDTDFAVGHTYRYVVRAVTKFGGQSVESLDSNDAVVAAADVFPPAAPQDLVAVIVPATDSQTTYIELSWSISSEADLAGYAVYRSDQPDSQGERLNSELLLTPTYRDTNVVAGQRYFYHVRAVDQAGNESPLSASAEAELSAR